MDTLGKQAHEAAIDHGLWLAPDDDETNYQAFVAGYLRGHTDRGVEATTARDEYDAEIASLRAKLEAVPVEEIRTSRQTIANERELDAIDRWLATVTKPVPLPETKG